MLIIHTGTNDHGEDLNAITKVKKLVRVTKEIGTENNVEIAFLGIFHRDDR